MMSARHDFGEGESKVWQTSVNQEGMRGKLAGRKTKGLEDFEASKTVVKHSTLRQNQYVVILGLGQVKLR